MKVLYRSVLLVAVLAAPASAQFDQFDWTLQNPNGVFAELQPCCMFFQSVLGQAPNSLATYTTQAAEAGRVSVAGHLFVEEGVCGASDALKILGVTSSTISSCNFTSTITFDVGEAQTFGFGLNVKNPSWSATLNLSSFSYTPYWTALGGGLAGSAGTPVLEGHGILQVGQFFRVELEQAKPAAPVALVVGLSEANLPFKGGVLVPSTDRIITGLSTDGAGGLMLLSIWPGGFPAGFEFIVQAWIVDAGGPQGFAASNAVHGEVL
jgi:hypothetical protein